MRFNMIMPSTFDIWDYEYFMFFKLDFMDISAYHYRYPPLVYQFSKKQGVGDIWRKIYKICWGALPPPDPREKT